MQKFYYKVKVSPEKTLEGSLEAESESQAANILINQGHFPLYIQSRPAAGHGNFFGRQRVSGATVYVFSHQLASLISSGMDLISSLNTLRTQTNNRALKALIEQVTAQVRDGTPLSLALGQYPTVFPRFYLAIIRSAEAAGNLEQALEQLAVYLAKEQELRANLRQAMIYPAFVAGVGVISVTVLMSFVVPRLAAMFQSAGLKLPLMTRLLIGISSWVALYWWAVLAIVLAGIWITKRWLGPIANHKRWDAFKFKLPMIGELALKIEVRNFCRSMATLLGSGIPIGRALEITADVVTNLAIKDEAETLRQEVDAGAGLAVSLKKSRYFPIFAANIIAVGEESGNLEPALAKVAQEYGSEVDKTVQTLTKLLEPLIILVMGLIVGFVVISMLLPIFELDFMAR